MIILAAQVLGSLNKDSNSQSIMYLAFWQMVVAAGIVCFIMGFVNIAASYLFRTKSLGVTARMVRAYGATAQQRVGDVYFAADAARPTPPTHTPSVRTAFSDARSSPRRSFSLPHGALPSYHPPETRQANSNARGLTISSPVPNDPEQFAKFKGSGDVSRPEMAAHPAFQGGRF